MAMRPNIRYFVVVCVAALFAVAAVLLMFAMSSSISSYREVNAVWKIQGVCTNAQNGTPIYWRTLSLWRGVFTYHSERFNTRATHIQCCPREPRTSAADYQQGSANRVRSATASGYVSYEHSSPLKKSKLYLDIDFTLVMNIAWR
jgi:hypothetical protein